MYYRIMRNDLLKNKVVSFAIVLFIAVAAMLVSLSAILMVNLSGAIDTLMKQAKTPHFMQMHTGPIDRLRLAQFASAQQNVDAFQLTEFLNIEGAKIIMNGKSLVDSVQDNGLSMQNETFDYLLDLNGKVIHPADGEIYVPVSYWKDGTAKIGEKVIIDEKEFWVAGFLRDSQMNSLLASSKRFLVSRHDYQEIKDVGKTEYLISFRLKDTSELGTFETAYNAAGLEANGPTITYPLFKMLNAISDGMMIAVILLISILVLIIAFLCIRFTLLAKIEEDYREIGVMKAIGLRVNDMKKIYLVQYAVLAAFSCMLGYALSFIFRGRLLENIRIYMGHSDNAAIALFLGMISCLLLFFIIIAYVNNVLRRFRKISAVEAICYRTGHEKASRTKYFRLNRNRLLNTNVFLGMQDIFARKRLYVTMLAVFVLATFIILVPQNLYHTISSKSFITYMGIGRSDLRMDIQQTDHIPEKTKAIAQTIEQDPAITKYAVLTTKVFVVKKPDGSTENIKIELGDHSIFPLEYATGRAPVAADEIALSILNAEELDKKVGDVMTLIIKGKKQDFTVCGTYSDITNGGKTAKAVFTDDTSASIWSVIYAELMNPKLVNKKSAAYTDHFQFAKVSDMDAYVTQTFGSTIKAVGKASDAALMISLVIAGLVTLLFMKMLVAKDRFSIAIKKSIGFTGTDIAIQYVARSVFVLIVGIMLGTVLANTLGEVLASVAISMFGASSFHFVVHPIYAYLLCPLIMICAVLIGTIFGISNIRKIKIADNIKG